MKTTALYLLALLLFLNVGCIGRKNREQSEPPGTCVTKTILDEHHNYKLIKTEGNAVGNNLELNIWLLKRETEARLQLMVIYKGLDLLSIDPGESLVLFVDGERIGLIGEGSVEHRSVLSRWWIMEMAAYDITPQQLKKIAYANEVKCRLLDLESLFSIYNFECFRHFYNEYIEGKAF